MRMFAGLVAALVLTACDGSSDGPAANASGGGFVPPEAQQPSPLPGQAQRTPLTAYVGKYPSDAVGGVAFYDRTEVANSLIGAVGDAGIRRRVTSHETTETPIFLAGERIAAHGCEPHNCAAHDWTFFVPENGGSGELCYHNAETMGDTSRWYANGPPRARPGACPQQQ